MRRIGLWMVMMLLVGSWTAWAGEPPKEAKPAKELLNAYGRVWVQGVPEARKDKQFHPKLHPPKPRLHTGRKK